MDHDQVIDRLDKVERRAWELMREHGLDDWEFRWDQAKRRLGKCSFRTRVISLSRPLAEVNSFEDSIATVLHEIAHALVGSGHGHDQVWKAMVASIGGRPERLADNTVELPPTWIGRCPSCGWLHGTHRRRQVACTACCERYNEGRYTERFQFVWSRAD